MRCTFINRLDPKTVGLLKRMPGMQVYDVPSAGHYTFPMRCDTAPFDNNDLRLALKYGIDREDLVSKILRGYGKIGNDHPVPEFDRSTPRTSRSGPTIRTRPSSTSASRA